MVLIERAGTVNSLKHLKDKEPWFKMVVSGPTKGNQLSGSKFSIPLVGTTSGSGLKSGMWMERLAGVLKEEISKASRLFTRKLLPPCLFEFEDDFFGVLENIQATTTSVIDDD
eukprot:scaffold29206_cov30-Attheya_sp.AAC.5